MSSKTNPTSLTFPPDSPRSAVASLMHDHGACLLEFLVTRLSLDMPKIRAALVQGKRCGLFSQDTTTKAWSLTPHGQQCWDRRDEHLAKGAPQQAGSTALHAQTIERMTGAGYTRFMGNGDRRPQVLRPGAMDFAEHPRVAGGWRIWRDGRRERISAANDAGQEAA